MGRISQETVEQIKNRADIVDIVGAFTPVHRRGKDFWCCCPFHHEKTPSCKLNQERQGFYCFGCKEHGNVITFVEKMVSTDYPGALRWIADRLGIPVVEEEGGPASAEAQAMRKLAEKRRSLLNDAAMWYHSLLRSPEAANARNYLDGRGLDAAAIEQFKIGYSLDLWDGCVKWAASFGYDMEDLKATGLVSENKDATRYYDRFRGRLMFPIWNELGKVVGFSARILDSEAKEAKYVNSPETEFFQKGQLLYGLNFARGHFKDFGHVLVCEGQLDVISCHRAGLVNAVAAQGTAFTEQHAKLLHKSVNNAVLSFDADTAGYKAAERTVKILHGAGFTVSIVTLPAGEDPDSVFRKGGAGALKQLMSVTEDAIPYIFRVACLQGDFDTPEGKSAIVTRVLEAIKPIGDEITRAGHCQWLAEKLNLEPSLIISRLNGMLNMDSENALLRPRPPRPNAPAPFSLEGNNGMPQPYAQGRVAAPPPFIKPEDPVAKAWGVIFDISLHLRPFAEELAFKQDVIDALPDTMLGIAVNQLLACTAQGEWDTAIEEISASDVFGDPIVGQAIMASEYADADPDDEKLRRAFDDCVSRVRMGAIASEIDKKQKEMQFESDPQKRNALFAEINQLILKRNELKRQRII